jgi:hypothetical protein
MTDTKRVAIFYKKCRTLSRNQIKISISQRDSMSLMLLYIFHKYQHIKLREYNDISGTTTDSTRRFLQELHSLTDLHLSDVYLMSTSN